MSLTEVLAITRVFLVLWGSECYGDEKRELFVLVYPVDDIFVKCVIHKEVVPKEKGNGSTSRMAELSMAAHAEHSQTIPGRGLNRRLLSLCKILQVRILRTRSFVLSLTVPYV